MGIFSKDEKNDAPQSGDSPAEGEEEIDYENLEDYTVKELKEIADEKDIDIPSGSLKADIVEIIQKAAPDEQDVEEGGAEEEEGELDEEEIEEAVDDGIHQGEVEWFDIRKGFGFINVDGLEEDAFIHYSEIEKASEAFKKLQEGERVEFKINHPAGKGPEATDLKRLDAPAEGNEIGTFL
jgi:CspA family cold shock protein